MVTDTAPTDHASRDDRRGRDLVRRFMRRRVLAHRRLLAFCCLVAAVASALYVLAPPAPATVRVRVAAADVAAGTVLQADDLAWVAFAEGTAPDGLAQAPVGRTTTGPVRRGEAITDARLVAPGLMTGHEGRVAIPVRLPDPAAVALLRAGDTVDLLAADPAAGRAKTVARGAVVVSVPRSEKAVDAQGQTGRLVVMGIVPEEVEDVTVAAVRDFLTVSWRASVAEWSNSAVPDHQE